MGFDTTKKKTNHIKCAVPNIHKKIEDVNVMCVWKNL